MAPHLSFRRFRPNTIDQAHRCVFFGRMAESILKKNCKGRHVHLRGTLRSQRVGDGEQARYYTSVLVEECLFSPRQNVEALRDALVTYDKKQRKGPVIN